MASRIAGELFDDDAWNRLVTRDIQDAREAGALSVLPSSLNFLACLRTHECELAAAERLLDEADDITAATGNAPIPNGRLLLAAIAATRRRRRRWAARTADSWRANAARVSCSPSSITCAPSSTTV